VTPSDPRPDTPLEGMTRPEEWDMVENQDKSEMVCRPKELPKNLKEISETLINYKQS